MECRSWKCCRLRKAQRKLVPNLCGETSEGRSTRKSQAPRPEPGRRLTIYALSRRSNGAAMEVRQRPRMESRTRRGKTWHVVPRLRRIFAAHAGNDARFSK